LLRHFIEIISIILDNVSPTFVDIGIFIGTIGFLFCFLLYARTFPVIAQAEVKTLKATGEIL
jgi:molybdopterin-containing oxidoreductase family membrane subunit